MAPADAARDGTGSDGGDHGDKFDGETVESESSGRERCHARADAAIADGKCTDTEKEAEPAAVEDAHVFGLDRQDRQCVGEVDVTDQALLSVGEWFEGSGVDDARS